MVPRRFKPQVVIFIALSSILFIILFFYEAPAFQSSLAPLSTSLFEIFRDNKTPLSVPEPVPENNLQSSEPAPKGESERITFKDTKTPAEVKPLPPPSVLQFSVVDGTSVFELDQKDPRLIEYIRTHHLTPPSTKSYNLTSKNQFHLNGYSRFVNRLYSGVNQKTGLFVEAGAYDGEVASNSLYLEEIGWKGLLVECNPLLLPKLRAKNRHAWIADVCLSTTNTPQMMNFTTLSEWPASAKLGRPLSPEEMKIHGIDWVSNKTWLNYQVPAFPLYSIIKATEGLATIDFLSLDVEGVEIQILKTFPFEALKIRMMIVEVHTFSDTEKTDLRTFMKSKGYKLAKLADIDDIYTLVSENFPPEYFI